MTITTRQYVELSDILALRFQCKHEDCGTTLEMPLNKFRKGILDKCPKCGLQWTTVSVAGPTTNHVTEYGHLFSQFIHAYEELNKALASVGCSVALEIRHTQ